MGLVNIDDQALDGIRRISGIVGKVLERCEYIEKSQDCIEIKLLELDNLVLNIYS